MTELVKKTIEWIAPLLRSCERHVTHNAIETSLSSATLEDFQQKSAISREEPQLAMVMVRHELKCVLAHGDSFLEIIDVTRTLVAVREF